MVRETNLDGEGDSDGDASNQKESLLSTQEKGNRNKRKFKHESRPAPPLPEVSSSLMKFPEYEELQEACNSTRITLESMKVKPNHKEDDASSVCAHGWEKPDVKQLETILSNDLHANLKTAIKKIAECGYSEQVAESVVLKCGPFCGDKDLVSNIMDRAMAYLRNENKGGETSKFHTFENLENLVDYMMLEMVNVLIHIKPSLSISDALWNLLIFDLNLSHACEAQSDPSKVPLVGGEGVRGGVSSTETPLESEPQHHETVASKSSKPNKSKPLNPNPQGSNSEEREVEEKCASGKKGSLGIAQRREALRQKALHFEKTYKGRLSKGAFKAKLASLGGLNLDKKQQSQSDSSSVTTKNPKLPSKDNDLVPVPVSASSASEAVPQNTKLAPKRETTTPPHKTADYYLARIPYDELQGKYLPQDDKDRVILAAVARVQSLEKELQSWDDWANVKVMQAAKRLSQDRTELKMLRTEKEEKEKLKNEKRVLDESTMKRISETTLALETSDCQLEMANSALHRLQIENSIIKQGMETARCQSSLEAEKLVELKQKEQEALKKSQSIEPEKDLLEQELKSSKRQSAKEQQELERTKSLFTQIEVQRAYAEREKVKHLKEAASIRKERERVEALAKAENERTLEKAEQEMKKYDDERKRIENKIAALKLEKENKKILAMRRDMNWQVSDGTKTVEGPHNSSWERSMNQKRDKECVMCLTEEKTVVLLPCAHQVLCANCNVMHEKSGMKECPSCRTPIQMRVAARFAKS